MEQPAVPNLRPLRLGELLDQAIRLYRANFLTFVGIIAVIYVPIMILQTAATTLMNSSLFNVMRSSPSELFSSPAYWIGTLSTFVLVFVQFFLVQGVATGALARAVGDNYLGRKTAIFDAYKGIGRSWLSLLGAILFIGVLFIVLFIWTIVPCIGWFTGGGMMMFLMTAVFPMTAPVVVLESQSAVAGVRRAWSLVRRRFWPVLGYVLVLYLFSLLVVNGPTTIIGMVLTSLQPFKGISASLLYTTIIQSLVSLIGVLIYYPLQMTAFTLIYFDLRVRTEGFDLALQTMNTLDSAKAIPAPPPLTNERIIDGNDLGNFAILTLAVAGIYILFFSIIMGGSFLFSSMF